MMDKVKIDYLYRMTTHNESLGVDDFGNDINGHNVVVTMKRYNVMSRTPNGAWIWLDNENRKRFVNLKAKKQFASNTELKAIDQFLHRNYRLRKILEARLNDVSIARRKAFDYKYKLEKEIEFLPYDDQLSYTG